MGRKGITKKKIRAGGGRGCSLFALPLRQANFGKSLFVAHSKMATNGYTTTLFGFLMAA